MAIDYSTAKMLLVRAGRSLTEPEDISHCVAAPFELFKTAGGPERLAFRVIAGLIKTGEKAPDIGDIVRVQVAERIAVGSMRRDVFRGRIVSRTFAAPVDDLAAFEFEAVDVIPERFRVPVRREDGRVDQLVVDATSSAEAHQIAMRELRDRGRVDPSPFVVPSGGGQVEITVRGSGGGAGGRGTAMDELRTRDIMQRRGELASCPLGGGSHDWIEITAHGDRFRTFGCGRCGGRRIGDPVGFGAPSDGVGEDVREMVRRRVNHAAKKKAGRPEFSVEEEKGRRKIRKEDL